MSSAPRSGVSVEGTTKREKTRNVQKPRKSCFCKSSKVLEQCVQRFLRFYTFRYCFFFSFFFFGDDSIRRCSCLGSPLIGDFEMPRPKTSHPAQYFYTSAKHTRHNQCWTKSAANRTQGAVRANRCLNSWGADSAPVETCPFPNSFESSFLLLRKLV